MLKYYLIIFAAFLIYKYIRQDTYGVIKIYNVEQGDAIYIRTTNGEKVIIDGGPNFEIDRYLQEEFTINTCHINLLVLTHQHYNHITGLNRLMQHCKVDNVLFNKIDFNSSAYSDWLTFLNNTNVLELYAGDTFEIDGLTFVVLWPLKIVIFAK